MTGRLQDALLWSALLGLVVLFVSGRRELRVWMSASNALMLFLLMVGMLDLVEDASDVVTSVLILVCAMATAISILAACAVDSRARRFAWGPFWVAGIVGLWTCWRGLGEPSEELSGSLVAGFALISGLTWACLHEEPQKKPGSQSLSSEKPAPRAVLGRLRAARAGGGALSLAHADSGAVSVASDGRGRLSRTSDR